MTTQTESTFALFGPVAFRSHYGKPTTAVQVSMQIRGFDAPHGLCRVEPDGLAVIEIETGCAEIRVRTDAEQLGALIDVLTAARSALHEILIEQGTGTSYSSAHAALHDAYDQLIAERAASDQRTTVSDLLDTLVATDTGEPQP